MGVGSHLDLPAQDSLVGLGSVDHAPVADLTVHNHGVGADLAARADDRVPPQDGAR